MTIDTRDTTQIRPATSREGFDSVKDRVVLKSASSPAAPQANRAETDPTPSGRLNIRA